VAHLRKSEDHQIGGVKVKEKEKEKKDLVDDALNATRAAVDPTKVVFTAAQDAVSSSPTSGSSANSTAS
jgi:hypothetical protein